MKHKVLTPTRINQIALQNRTVVAPLSRVSTCGDGVPTPLMAKYYGEFSQGGFALIVTEGCYTDTDHAQAYPNQPGLTNPQQQEGWQAIAQAVHQHGNKVVLQLMHAGALNQHLDQGKAPSAVQPKGSMMAAYSVKNGAYPMPSALTQEEIDKIKRGFIDTAKRAAEAGFDGVEVHSANGYLLDQFVTHYSNQRQDQYGGETANRIRLTAEIIAELKAELPADFIVGVRLSQGKVNDFDYRWPNGLKDGEVIFPAVAAAGADYIHFAAEGKGFHHHCLTDDGESLPQQARNLTGLPVICNGGMEDHQLSEQILAEGHGDLVALGKGALSNPNWPERIAEGTEVSAFNPAMFSEGVTVEAQYCWLEEQAV